MKADCSLDGNSLTYRAFFALPTDMATAVGQVTNAVFGFTSMLINLLKDHKPDGVLVAFDRPEPTFRHEANPSTRPTATAAPDILRQQMGLVRQVLDALRRHAWSTWPASRPTTSSPRSPTQAEAAGDDVIIVTGDRDTLPARRRPARQGALQPPRRQRLRALRRGRHRGAAPASRRRSTRSTPRSAATRATTCRRARAWGRRRRPS